MNARLVIIVVRSSTDRRLTAEMIPTGIAISIHRITAPVTRKIVAGSRSRMISLTGVLFWKMLSPRSIGPSTSGSWWEIGVNTPSM